LNCPRDPNPGGTIDNWEQELLRLEAIKRKKDTIGPDTAEMQVKTVNMLAERLGGLNVFAQEDISSVGSSVSDSGNEDDMGFFKDIMHIKGEVSFHSTKVKPTQNLHNVPEIVTKEMAHETKLMNRAKAINSSNLNSANGSKLGSPYKTDPDLLSDFQRRVKPYEATNALLKAEAPQKRKYKRTSSSVKS
jgi:hypothetical protein